MQAAAEDPAVRCVVLTGTGRAFCTGQDLKEHVGAAAARRRATCLFGTVDEHYNPTVAALASMAKPVIAAVNGVAAGAGASLAFACDLRVVADTAGFNLAFANIALSCDTGASTTLQRLVGRAKAMELLYFPRTVKAEEALELGLATQVVPADELDGVVGELARGWRPARRWPTARCAARWPSPPSTPSSEALAFEGAMMARTGATADHRRRRRRRSWPRRSRPSSRSARAAVRSGRRSPARLHVGRRRAPGEAARPSMAGASRAGAVLHGEREAVEASG